MSRKINRALLQDILSKGPGVKTISGDAIDWCIAVACEAAKSLAASGRKTPGGRLMAPRMDAGLMARTVAAKEPALGEGDCAVQEDPQWSLYNDWQQEVRQGKSKLPFEEWKNEKKT